MDAWRYLAWDPIQVLEHVVSGLQVCEPSRRALPRLMAALERQFGAPAAASAEQAAWDGPALPPFCGGAVGLLGFDLGRELELLPDRLVRDVPLPDLSVGLYPFVLAEEVESGRRLLLGRGQAGEWVSRRAELEALARTSPALTGPSAQAAGAPTSTFSRRSYEAAVERILGHIRCGDIYQVNLSQRFELPFAGRASELFHAVSSQSPVPFASLMRTPDWSLVSNSPELFLRRRAGLVESRPIKGTRPRGATPAEDERLRVELESSEKELAELAMIVDLVRNDLGRSAVVGSVTVDLPFETDAWATVFHRMARVSARLPPEMDLAPVLEAAFPPASVTGTPKIRALEIIEAVEPVRRHAYTGALGWIGADGDCDLSVNIRTATLNEGRLLVPVGGGLTVGSDPAAEYLETLHKARALFEAAHVPLPHGSLVA